MNSVKTQAHRVALVTGAGRRIGAAIAEALHQAGFAVAIHCYRAEAAAVALCDRLNQSRANTAHVFTADLTHYAQNQALIPKVLAWGGRLDLLVNNAALFIKTTLDEVAHSQWAALFALNVQAPFWLSCAARAALSVHQGAIINITDIHSERPLKGYAEYCQSKAALTMQTKALALEFAPAIRVNAVAPGAIAWPEQENALSHAQQQKIIEKTLLKQHGNPAYIAQAVLALVENPFITGQILRVDGGRP